MELYRGLLQPSYEGVEGFVSAQLLLDRQTGVAQSTTVWSNAVLFSSSQVHNHSMSLQVARKNAEDNPSPEYVLATGRLAKLIESAPQVQELECVTTELDGEKV